MHWRRYLNARTHNPQFLWRMVAVILVIGVVIAAMVQGIAAPSLKNDQSVATEAAFGSNAADRWRVMLRDPDAFESVLTTIVSLHQIEQANRDVVDPLLKRSISLDPYRAALDEDWSDDPTRQAIANGLWRTAAENEPDPELLALAEGNPPPRYANQALAEYYRLQGDLGRAHRYLQREGRFPDAESARKDVLAVTLQAGDDDLLRKLAADPLYADLIDTGVQLELAADRRDWLKVLRLLPYHEWSRTRFGPAALALFSGCCWLVFMLHAGQIRLPWGARAWLCLAAVPLGLVSVLLTDFMIYYQEEVWGLTYSSELADGAKFFVLGVGLREELSKLVMLLPLIPFLVRRGNTLETLTVSALVGLGFAILENQLYFARDFGVAAVGRFATANFFHMASTGLIGLAVVRGLRNLREQGPEMFAWFAVIVIAHGLYDSFIALPALAEYSIVTAIILVLLAYQFFNELRYARQDREEPISLTATYLAGVSLVAAASLIYISSMLSLTVALAMLMLEGLSLVLMVYVFLREMPNSIIPR